MPFGWRITCKGPAERTIGSEERENKRTMKTIGRLGGHGMASREEAWRSLGKRRR